MGEMIDTQGIEACMEAKNPSMIHDDNFIVLRPSTRLLIGHDV